MALLTLPSGFNARSASWTFIRPSDTAIELFGGKEVYLEYENDTVYYVSIPLITKTEEDSRPWRSFLMQASLMSNTFEIPPPGWVNGASYSGNNPVVKGAGQTGKSLEADGAALSATIALEGDYITLPTTQLVVLTTNAVSDGSGNVTFEFEPAMKVSPTDNETINVKTPVLTARLLDPKAEWLTNPPVLYDHDIIAVEARPVS